MKHKDIVTYVTIPVRMTLTAEDTYRVEGIDLTDDGDPGAHGNTYVWYPEEEQGEWVFDMGAQAEAYDHVAKSLVTTEEKK